MQAAQRCPQEINCWPCSFKQLQERRIGYACVFNS